jgi:hypothetical protein
LHTYEVSVIAAEDSTLLSVRDYGVERYKMELDVGKTYLSLSWEADSRTTLGNISGYRSRYLLRFPRHQDKFRYNNNNNNTQLHFEGRN